MRRRAIPSRSRDAHPITVLGDTTSSYGEADLVQPTIRRGHSQVIGDEEDTDRDAGGEVRRRERLFICFFDVVRNRIVIAGSGATLVFRDGLGRSCATTTPVRPPGDVRRDEPTRVPTDDSDADGAESIYGVLEDDRRVRENVAFAASG